MSTSSFPEAACRRTDRAGSPAGEASSCPCAYSRACSAGSSSTASQPCTQPVASPSSATSRPSPTSDARGKLDGTSVFVRELLPQDRKIEADQLTSQEAIGAAG